ncbi:unnamed protein product, partial [Durusdinium trenchii]
QRRAGTVFCATHCSVAAGCTARGTVAMEDGLQVTPQLAKRLLRELLQRMRQNLERGEPCHAELPEGGGFRSAQELRRCLADAVANGEEDPFLKPLFALYEELADLGHSREVSGRCAASAPPLACDEHG